MQQRPQDRLQKFDDALYRAKETGRNSAMRHPLEGLIDL
jgi:PleD family two-component response regulator